ncbi:patatin-like phospholipase family protein [Bacillus sp. FJAT-45350]|uniref:patatin-like phospholipase family protein n=1 Tax=Bacillus sp. FJAT-45350 TaxID=2011014 RepID=UPI000BB939EE|nr:patatin-like phospholipase family protein [Bacillus sp. FJAT-45350]
MTKPKIGLALGAGGARGFAHVGVLKALEEENIPIDYIAGSSMGSLVGAIYGSGQTIENLIKFATLFRRKYYLDLTVPKMGFVSGKKVKELIKILSKGKSIEELSPNLSIVATDLLNGERVVFTKGPVAPAVRASISIPGIFVPEKVDGRLLIDGGVVDKVPVSTVRQMGADITIGVDVSYFQVEPEINTIYDVILQSMDIMEREMGRYREIDADVMIRPMIKQSKSLVFTNVEEYIELGSQETKNQISSIKQAIEDWKEKINE